MTPFPVHVVLLAVGGWARQDCHVPAISWSHGLTLSDNSGHMAECGRKLAARYGCSCEQPLAPIICNVLAPLLSRGDFLLNLSVDVSSLALIELCAERGALYLDTCIEPWAGGYTDPALTPSLRSNYSLREKMLALRAKLGPGPTAAVTHGANPGLVSHFVKQAILNVANDTQVDAGNPATRAEWAALAHKLNIKIMHVAERDTQVPSVPKRAGEFVNTVVDGFGRRRHAAANLVGCARETIAAQWTSSRIRMR